MNVRENVNQQGDNGSHRRYPGYARADEPPPPRYAGLLFALVGEVVRLLPRSCLPLELVEVRGELAHLSLEGDNPAVELAPASDHGRACLPEAGAFGPFLAWRPFGWAARRLASRAR